MSRERVELARLHPRRSDETIEAWTDRLLTQAGAYGTYRQCSIGWHDECSQRHLGADADCLCTCHSPGVEMYSVEGHVEDGAAVVTRVEVGRQFWPPKADEPESAWARWILASSVEDASAKGKAAEETQL